MKTNTKTTTTNTNTTTSNTSEVITPAQYVAKYGTKSAAIRALLASGKTRGEVAKLLEVRYQHVRNVEITPIKKQKEVAPGKVAALPGLTDGNL